MRQNRGEVWLHSFVFGGFITRGSRFTIKTRERTQQNHEGQTQELLSSSSVRPFFHPSHTFNQTISFASDILLFGRLRSGTRKTDCTLYKVPKINS